MHALILSAESANIMRLSKALEALGLTSHVSPQNPLESLPDFEPYQIVFVAFQHHPLNFQNGQKQPSVVLLHDSENHQTAWEMLKSGKVHETLDINSPFEPTLEKLIWQASRNLDEPGQIDMEAKLKEKELILKEIYHRVKNNLQVISSIMNLQGRKAPHPNTRSILKESQNRILAMALVHEKLYESGNLVNLQFGDYLQELGKQVAFAYGGGLSQIELSFDIRDEIYLDIDTAIPCGLIVNELLTNAYRHAFVGNDKGQDKQIELRLKQKSKNICEFMVQDNGTGLGKDFDFDNASSLGLRLVKSLAHQIDGVFSFASIDGTCIILEFPIFSPT